MVPLPTQSGSPTTGAIPTEVDRPRDSPFESFSILWPPHVQAPPALAHAPSCCHDLNLDQIIEGVTAGWTEYGLEPHFYTQASDVHTIAYRQEVMRDLEHPAVKEAVGLFSQGMQAVRRRLTRADHSTYPHERERVFVGAAELYCQTVEQLAQRLRQAPASSRGLRAFGAYLAVYIRSDAFRHLASDAHDTISALGAIQYTLQIRGSAVTVRRYADEADYSQAIEATFERFRRQPAKDYRTRFPETSGLNHIEAQIVERVAWLYPDAFATLHAFYTRHSPFDAATIVRFDREVQFYRSYLAYIEPLKQSGLPFCYPEISYTSREIHLHDAFDLALARRLPDSAHRMVPNDLELRGVERLIVVSGPNQGGKTTFARTIGQVHYLASLGCPVPGTAARLSLVDRIFTHFERQEHVTSLRGKLKDDLVRIRAILDRATPRSLVVLNEIFASTTLDDAVSLGRRILARLSELDLTAVCVTFLTELASYDEKTVSLVSMVDSQDPSIRTYKVVRKPADGLAYAVALARKHRVTYDWIARRMKR